MNIINLRSKKFAISIMIIMSANYSLANIHDQVKYDPYKGKIIVTESNHPNRVRIFTAAELGDQNFQEIVQAIKIYNDNLRKFSQGGGANLSNERTRQQMEPINNRLSYDKLSYAERQDLQNQMEVLKNKIQSVPEHMLTTADIIARINYAFNANANSQAYSPAKRYGSYAEQALFEYDQRMAAFESQRIYGQQENYEFAQDKDFKLNRANIDKVKKLIQGVVDSKEKGNSFLLDKGSSEIGSTTVKDRNKMRQYLNSNYEVRDEFEKRLKMRTLLEFLQTDKFVRINLDQVPLEPSTIVNKNKVSIEYIYDLFEKLINSQDLNNVEKKIIEKIFVHIPEEADRLNFIKLVYGYKVRKDLEHKFIDSMRSIDLRVLKIYIFLAMDKKSDFRYRYVGGSAQVNFMSNIYPLIRQADTFEKLLPFLNQAVQRFNSSESFVTEFIVPLVKVKNILSSGNKFSDFLPKELNNEPEMSELKDSLKKLNQSIQEKSDSIIKSSIDTSKDFDKDIAHLKRHFPSLNEFINQWAISLKSSNVPGSDRSYYIDKNVIKYLMNQRNLNSNPNVIMCLRNYK